MKKLLSSLFTIAALLSISCSGGSGKPTNINISAPQQGEDATPIIREALQTASKLGAKEITISLTDGEYRLLPELATERYIPITNHGNGSKKIAFLLENFDKVTIEGNGAELIFHGQMMPFLLENCNNVTIKDLTIDWDVPFTFLGEVIAVDPKGEWREIKPRTKEDGFSWKLAGGRIKFPNIDGFSYTELGSTLAFTPDTKRPIVGALDLHSNPTKVEKLPNGNLKIYEKLRQMPPVGSLLSSKGNREDDRYAPAFDMKECKNIRLENVTVHHALGMAFLFERSEDITISDCNVILRDGSNRVISSTADATHFANCKGDILVENCTFQNMLDDGTNVHGTYVVVTDILNSKTVRVALQHFEQMGFKFADKGDDMWFIKTPSPERAEVRTVNSTKNINEKYIDIEFTEAIPSDLKVGDILENKTWNPTYTMRGCTIQNIRARAVIIKTPEKIVIEDNYFSSMMSGVLLRGESNFWYESGAVTDVTIQNNTFHNSGDCGSKHAALYITPVFGKGFDKNMPYDRGIKFINNKIDTFNPRVVIAENAEDLLIEGNTIILNNDGKATFPDAPVFDLTDCVNVTIQDNSHKADRDITMLEADETSLKTLSTDLK